MTTQTDCPTTNGASATRPRNTGLGILCWLIAILFIVVAISIFPREGSRTQTVKLLSLPATEGQLIQDPRAIYVSSADAFLILAKGEQVTMAIQEDAAVYEVVVKDIPFRYWQYAGAGLHYSIAGEEYSIEDGVLTRRLVRDNTSAFFSSGLVLFLGGVMFCLGLVVCSPKRKIGHTPPKP